MTDEPYMPPGIRKAMDELEHEAGGNLNVGSSLVTDEPYMPPGIRKAMDELEHEAGGNLNVGSWVLLVAGTDDEPIPCGWICEDCDFGAFTLEDAERHSDEHRHSLAVCPLWMPRRPETEPERIARLAEKVPPPDKPREEWTDEERESFAEFYVDEGGYA